MMNKNFIIKSGLVIILFSIAIYEDNRVISFIFFTLPWFIILYPFFFKKQIYGRPFATVPAHTSADGRWCGGGQPQCWPWWQAQCAASRSS
jgi:hypothetical protein